MRVLSEPLLLISFFLNFVLSTEISYLSSRLLESLFDDDKYQPIKHSESMNETISLKVSHKSLLDYEFSKKYFFKIF